VQYGRLVDIVASSSTTAWERPLAQRFMRGALKTGLTSPFFATAMKMGQLVRPLLPASLKAKVPAAQNAGAYPSGQHQRRHDPA